MPTPPLLIASILVAAAGLVGSHASLAACTREQAEQTAGRLVAEPDARLEPDVRTLRARKPALAATSDRAIALIRQALPNLDGFEVRAHHTVDARTLAGGEAVRFGVSVGFFAYYCVPVDGYDPRIAGTVRLGEETGMWIDVAFNSLSWLAHERRQVSDMTLPHGRAIYFAAKERGSLQGQPIFLPEVNPSRAEEAIVLSAGGRSPWIPVTRADLLDARIAALRHRLDALPANPSLRAPLDAEMAALVAARAGLSVDERMKQAVVTNPYAPTASLFSTTSGRGRDLTTVDRTAFARGTSAAQINLVTVAWRWDPKSSAQAEKIKQFKEKLDVNALAALLGPPR